MLAAKTSSIGRPYSRGTYAASRWALHEQRSRHPFEKTALLVRSGARLARDVPEVPHQLRPAGEAILSCDDELRVSELDARGIGAVDPRMLRGGAGERLGIAGPEPAE